MKLATVDPDPGQAKLRQDGVAEHEVLLARRLHLDRDAGVEQLARGARQGGRGARSAEVGPQVRLHAGAHCEPPSASRRPLAVCAQRSRANCSTLVGRPRGRFTGGGSAGRLDSIHARTSCSHQQRRLLCGILKCGGIRCRYFSLVAQVRIVFVVLPISSESSSI